MRLAVGDAVAGPVPAIYRPVVEPQRLELRRLSAGHLLERVLVEIGAHERAEARDVLAEQLGHRLPDPARAEHDSRGALAHVLLAGARVHGLLEQRDARLGPQPPAEEER